MKLDYRDDRHYNDKIGYFEIAFVLVALFVFHFMFFVIVEVFGFFLEITIFDRTSDLSHMIFGKYCVFKSFTCISQRTGVFTKDKIHYFN